jgi:hypothetical protein
VKTILAIATVAVMAISAPAFAQSAGNAGATGTGATGSGSNTPGSGVDKSMTTAPSGGMQTGGATKMQEGRAVSRDAPAGDKADDTPKTVRGDQNSQDKAK